MDKKIGQYTYRLGKMDARKQFHVLRRISPLLVSMEALPQLFAIIMAKRKEGQPMPEEDAGMILISAAQPFVKAMAKMEDTDLDYVINACFAVSARLTADGKAQPLLAMDGASFMFADLTMADMLLICFHSVEENHGSFFDLIPSVSGPPETEAQPSAQ